MQSCKNQQNRGRGEWFVCENWRATRTFISIKATAFLHLYHVRFVQLVKLSSINSHFIFDWNSNSEQQGKLLLWMNKLLCVIRSMSKELVNGRASYEKPRQHIKRQRHHLSSSQSCGFSSGQVWMWQLDHKEGSAPKNWCFWTVVLEKTLNSSLDWKEVKSVDPKGNQALMFTRRNDAEAEAPILGPPDGKSQLFGKDPHAGQEWRQEEKGSIEDAMVGWHHPPNGHEFEQTPEDSEG